MLDYDDLPILEVIKEARENKDDFASNYIIDKYKGMVHGVIRSGGFYLPNGDYDDVFQEGIIGLHKAIKVYDENSGPFEMFCKLVIKRHLITAIKKANRYKHKILNDVYSFDKAMPDNENLTMMDVIGNKEEVFMRSDLDCADPEEKFILQETQRRTREMLEKMLSEKEAQIHKLHKEGKPYKEIMEELDISNAKEVDNTIQRIKRKFREVQLLSETSLNDIDEPIQKIN